VKHPDRRRRGDAEREVFHAYRDDVYDLLKEKDHATIGNDG
jgi:hypothetical protein